MDQPLFSCTKCFRNFPQSEMSRSGQSCKTCNPHHSIFKQCEYCKSDFKNHVYGTLCPRCQSLKSKYGDPQQCTICCLQMAFGNALVCQRCLHYRNRFGEPRSCQSCGQKCAFLKDEASRQKVDGQILCWVCTYNFKLARSREHTERSTSNRSHDFNSSGSDRRKLESYEKVKRHRPDDYRHASPTRHHNHGPRKASDSSDHQKSSQTTHSNLDSVYNENLLTIGQLEDEVKLLKRLLSQKEVELLNKDRSIAELRSEIIEIKGIYEDKLLKAKSVAQVEQDRLSTILRQLQREKVTLSQSVKRRSSTNLAGLSGPAGKLRHSASSVSLLFNPDSPTHTTSSTSTRLSQARPTVKAGRSTAARNSHSVATDRFPTAALRTDHVASEPHTETRPGKRSNKSEDLKDEDDGQQQVKADGSTYSNNNTPSSLDEALSSPNLQCDDTVTPSPDSPQQDLVPVLQPTSAATSVSSLTSVDAGKDQQRFDEDPLGFVTDSEDEDEDDG